ncbi:hypothetical protein BC828DRAFT_381276 [Blastocladiella britannica]|nr:hypothetical protein BC828DRAFT_381276 [Blastocladiella britannica]
MQNQAAPRVQPRPFKGSDNLRAVLPSNAVEQTVFTVAYLIAQGHELPHYILWILTFVEDIQLLSFPLTSIIFPNLPPVVEYVLEPIRALTDYNSFALVNSLALALVFFALAVTCVVSIVTHRQTRVPSSVLQLLRMLFSLQFHALNIPIATLFLGGIACSTTGTLLPFNVACFTMPHLPLFIMNCIGLLVFVPLLGIGAHVFIDSLPTSQSPHAKAHGQVEFLSIAVRLALIILRLLAGAFPTSQVMLWIYMATSACLLAYLAYNLIVLQPFYHVTANIVRSAFTAGSALSMIAGMVNTAVYPKFQYAWATAIVAAVVGAHIGAVGSKVFSEAVVTISCRHWFEVRQYEHVTAAASPVARRTVVPSQPGYTPSSLVAQENKLGVPGGPRAVASLNDMARDFATRFHGGSPSSPSSPGRPSGASDTDQARLLQPSPIATSLTARRGSVMINKDTKPSILTGLLNGNSTDVLNAINERTPKRRKFVFSSPMHLEVCLRFIRGDPTPKQVALGRQLIERGLVEYPQDPMLLLLASTYLACYYGDEGTGVAEALMKQLQSSTRIIPAPIKFLIYVRDRSARDNGESVLERAAIESLTKDARKHHINALQGVRQVLEAIRAGTSPGEITYSLQMLAREQDGALTCYQRLLSRVPRDQRVLRSYAQFLTCVQGDTFKANQLLELADAIENRGNPMSDAGMAGAPEVNISIESTPEYEVGLASGRSKRDRDPSPSGRKYPGVKSNNGSINNLASSTRHRVLQRKLVVARINRPLNGRHWLIAGCMAVIAALIGGFYLVYLYFSAAADILDQFSVAIAIRLQAIRILESIRLMTLASYAPVPTTTYTAARAALKTQVTALIPLVGQFATWEAQGDTGTSATLVRVYLPTFTGSAKNFVSTTLSPLQAIAQVLKAGKLAYSFKTNLGLNSQVFQSNMELRAITANLVSFQAAINGFTQVVIDSNTALQRSNFTTMIICIGVSVVVFGLATGLIAGKLIKPFFDNELQVLHMLRRVPKRVVQGMLTQVEEDLENYKEIVEDDEEPNDTDLMRQAASESQSSQERRWFKHLATMVFGMLLLTGMITSMFSTTLIVDSGTNSLLRFVQSANRELGHSQWRMLTREYFYNDSTYSSDFIVQSCRSTILDYENDLSTISMTGLDLDFPALTTQNRVCTNGCREVVEQPAIGFTLALASLSLNDEVNRFMTIIDSVTAGMASSLTNPQDRTSNVYQQWLLSVALSSDIDLRLDTLTQAMTDFLVARLTTNWTNGGVIFGASLLVLTATVIALHVFVIQRLLAEGKALASLVFLVPMVNPREVAEVVQFLDTGGIMLQMKGQATSAAATAAAANAAAMAQDRQADAKTSTGRLSQKGGDGSGSGAPPNVYLSGVQGSATSLSPREGPLLDKYTAGAPPANLGSQVLKRNSQVWIAEDDAKKA